MPARGCKMPRASRHSSAVMLDSLWALVPYRSHMVRARARGRARELQVWHAVQTAPHVGDF